MKKARSKHKNSLDNEEEHHLYEVYDDQEKETFKYGISCDPLEKDGLSRRIRRQVDVFNLAAGWTILRQNLDDWNSWKTSR